MAKKILENQEQYYEFQRDTLYDRALTYHKEMERQIVCFDIDGIILGVEYKPKEREHISVMVTYVPEPTNDIQKSFHNAEMINASILAYNLVNHIASGLYRVKYSKNLNKDVDKTVIDKLVSTIFETFKK